jgi:hypothetical protein
MLYLTALLYGTVIIHALFKHDVTIGILTTILYGTSILHHANQANPFLYRGGHLIKFIDRVTAIILILIVGYKTSRLPFNTYTMVIWMTIVYVSLVYPFKVHCKDSYYNKEIICETQLWHASVHIVSWVGLHVYLLLSDQ